MTRPAGWIRGVENLAGRARLGQGGWKSHGSDRVRRSMKTPANCYVPLQLLLGMVFCLVKVREPKLLSFSKRADVPLVFAPPAGAGIARASGPDAGNPAPHPHRYVTR